MADRADSLLWTTPASDVSAFDQLVVPDNLDELVREILNDPIHRKKIEDRVKRYRPGRVRWQTLYKPIR